MRVHVLLLFAAAAFNVSGARSLAAQNPPSPGAATAWSVGATLGGIGLLGLAERQSRIPQTYLAGTGWALLIAGPSFGFFYAGEIGRGAGSTLLRAGSLSGAGLAALAAQGGVSGMVPLIFIGAGVALGSAAVDLVTADDAARRAAGRLEVGAVLRPGGAGLEARIRF